MLYCLGFESVAVVAADMYFQDSEPLPGQEGAEHGVRLEVRLLERHELRGDIYSAQPIELAMPVWRADLLESVDGRPGSFDRTHHHPGMDGWNVGTRDFQEDLKADPLGWVGRQLADLDALLDQAGIDRSRVDPADAQSLRLSVPEILAAVGRLLDRIRAGELARPPVPAPPPSGVLVRAGWL
jgi:hypothetical protein